MPAKTLDLICIGRVAVDLYSEQVGSRLEDTRTLAKYLGGSSGNVAFGTARLGLKSAMLARVGDDHMGRFIREELASVGCDTRYLISDPDHLTALVLLGVKDQAHFPLLFYRDHCADMQLATADISEESIASAKVLHITGTHLSSKRTAAACRKALDYAHEYGTRTSLDIDYRPVLWGLTGKAEGENRFVDEPRVTSHIQSFLPFFELVVGTEEEIHIAGGSTDTLAALRTIRALTTATIVLKRGPLGAIVFTGGIPECIEQSVSDPGFKVHVLNVLGAGDAFMSGLLWGYIQQLDWPDTLHYANACGALVVSRHGCAPAMPTGAELEYFLIQEETIKHPDQDFELTYLHRVGSRRKVWPELCVLAFDHRWQLEEMADEVGADKGQLVLLKQLIMKAVKIAATETHLGAAAGILCDARYGQEVLNQFTGQGGWVGRSVELAGSRPVQIEGSDNAARCLRSWPTEHVVKCLVQYHPDDDTALRFAQEQQVRALFEDCCASGHELLLEVVLPSTLPEDDHTLVRVMRRFYNLRIRPDWWKLRVPSRAAWQAINTLLNREAPLCRGVVILGQGSSLEQLQSAFNISTDIECCKGFMVGRTIFALPAQAWLSGSIDDQSLINAVAENYIKVIELWRRRVF